MKKKSMRNVDVHNGFGEWGGYMDAKVSKLDEQFAEDAIKNPYKESDLFAGISIFVNGLTNPSADELKRIMMKNGGIYHTYQRQSTNFIIATNLPDVKIRQITSAKIISPLWVVDCLKENKILDYSKYLLYTNCKTSQPKIAFGKKGNVRKEDVKHDQLAHNGNDLIDQQSNGLDADSLNILTNLNMLNSMIREDGKILSEVSEDHPKSIPWNGIKAENRKTVARTAVDPNFLSEFYNNSRLHHIATLGAGFKHHISKLRESHNGLFPARDQLKQNTEVNSTDNSMVNKTKYIMHIDMDCFFVSVGLRSRPHLRGLPIAVTHSKASAAGNQLRTVEGVDRKKEMEMYVKRHDDKHKVDQSKLDDEEVDRTTAMPLIDNSVSLSEIASCSYEARKKGVKNGMFVGAALKLCPQLQTIPYDFDAYKEVAHTLYDTITQYTLDVEAVSCDEMYVNLIDVLKHLNWTVDEFVAFVRNEIIQKTQCLCSAGIGANKLQARMATKRAKPNGQFHLLPENVEKYFSEILISDLPGVGYSTTQKLHNLCLKTCSDLQQIPLGRLQHDFGKKLGETLYQYCRGIDNKPLNYDQVRKSVSAEVNYGIRFTEVEELDTFLRQLCGEVHSRLTEIGAKGKTITLKYMVRAQDAPTETAKFMGHGFCDHVTKSTTLPKPTCDLSVISQTIFSIKTTLNISPKELRGIGIQISKLDSGPAETSKSNTLKNMFKNVIAKNEQASKISDDKRANVEEALFESITDRRLEKPSSLRKVKSFGGTSNRDINLIKTKLPNHKLRKIYEELDLNVLAELPDYIREEILRDQESVLKENASKTETSSTLYQSTTHKKLTARKLENDFQSSSNIKFEKNIDLSETSAIISKPQISEGNILNSSEWRQVLLNWLESTQEPIDCDVTTIVDYFKEFMALQMLSEVMLCLRYLHRKISEIGNCNWHRVYYRIVNLIQHHMALSYGPNFRLFVKENFDCLNCSNKTSA